MKADLKKKKKINFLLPAEVDVDWKKELKIIPAYCW